MVSASHHLQLVKVKVLPLVVGIMESMGPMKYGNPVRNQAVEHSSEFCL